MRRVFTIVVVICAMPPARAQNRNAPRPQPAPAIDVVATLKDAANALGMLRQANRMDAINTMELWGAGTSYALGQQYHADGPWPPFKTEWHAMLSYAESAMRVDMVRNNPDGPGPIQGGGFLPLAAPQTLITVVAGKYAWNESEIGAGLVPGKGAATTAFGTTQDRQVLLWTLPHGAIKAAMAAGSKAVATIEGGVTMVTFPLPGELSGLTARMTLDDKKRPVKVETRIDNPVLGDMVNETSFSDYALLDEVQTDVYVPGHVVQKQGGFPVLDIKITRTDTNNPYEIFPIPDAVMRAFAAPPAAPKVDITKIGDGVYYLAGESHHSVAVEFRNYVALVECPLGDARADAVIAAVKRNIPRKPIRYVVNTHHHFDHSGGLRACVAEGATILTQAENKPYYEKVWAMPHTISPDRLAKMPRPRKPLIEPVITRRVLSDGRQSLEIYQMEGSNHDASMLFAYVPKAKVLIEADAYTPGAANAPPTPPTKETRVLNDNLQRLKLDVQQIAPIHGRLVTIQEFRRAVGANSTN
ncbi:MAG: MBL fold metallo-hydrolase [Acidobacteria bacterium]|nr:MAG: MBL fold metallo-hydrolase [Acidobacteriota bacterium]